MLSCWQERLMMSSSVIMRRFNPVVIPRNHKLKKYWWRQVMWYDLLHGFLNILADPYEN